MKIIILNSVDNLKCIILDFPLSIVIILLITILIMVLIIEIIFILPTLLPLPLLLVIIRFTSLNFYFLLRSIIESFQCSIKSIIIYLMRYSIPLLKMLITHRVHLIISPIYILRYLNSELLVD